MSPPSDAVWSERLGILRERLEFEYRNALVMAAGVFEELAKTGKVNAVRLRSARVAIEKALGPVGLSSTDRALRAKFIGEEGHG